MNLAPLKATREKIMEYVNFEIEGINVGWFDMIYNTKKENVTVSATDAYGNDSPKYFLQMLCDFLANEIHAGYVLFDEEPGIYIVCIEKEEQYNLSIFFSESEDICKKFQTYGKFSASEIKEQVCDIEEMLAIKGISMELFAKTVVRSFEEYSLGKGKKIYEENWMDFPEEEFMSLQKHLYKKEEGERRCFEQALGKLLQQYKEEFPWIFIESDNQYFLEELKREINPGHPLYGQTLDTIAKSESDDNIIVVLEDGKYAIIHLTYSENEDVKFPYFLQFNSRSALVESIEKQYLEEYR